MSNVNTVRFAKLFIFCPTCGRNVGFVEGLGNYCRSCEIHFSFDDEYGDLTAVVLLPQKIKDKVK